ncbi:D-2-hydroxyacid dehydrogenase family protein [Marinivivus vitaminiproducens]|uniref:D-2-hydroxyacid dehydrogenase family protein n=1 Tax=Marinivivus vitaminiproducens TaxID=3035935 RepID=UPI00279CE830|nr:D-2-hydroxyacid dehydrogenase family protein [Geminicoccaceae bacterium SCSIO 64248]
MTVRIAILDDYQNLALSLADWSRVRERAEVVVFDRHLGSIEVAAEALTSFDVLCTLRERMAVPAELIDALPNLKAIAITGKHHRTLDMAAATAHGIPVMATGSGADGQYATAELAWGLIIGLLRHIPGESAGMRAGGWQTTLGTCLFGKRLGLVGLGRLGGRMAMAGNAFGMDVVAWSPNLTEERARDAGARLVGKDELFRESDVVSLHIVLSERSRGVVGAADLARMKSSAILVNTSRGPLVDQDALIAALRGGRIAGAGIDVFDREPLPADHPLRALPNVLLTPHLGYTVRETFEAFYRETVANLEAWLAGAPVNVTNPEAFSAGG